MSDFTLLQETSRVVDAATRTLAVIEGDEIVGKGEARRLTLAAEDRGIRLTYMSKGLARHKRNTTVMRTVPHYRTAGCGIKGSKLIFWHLDVYFSDPTGNYSGSQLVKLENIAEDTVIESITSKALQNLCKRNKRVRSSPFISTREHNNVYDHATVSDLEVYLENEFVPMSSIPIPVTKKLGSLRYDPIDTSRSLLSILKGRAVIEFPILRIAPKQSSASLVLAQELFGHFELPDAEGDDSSSQDSDSDSESSVLEKVSGEKPAQSNEVKPPVAENSHPNTTTFSKPSNENSSSILTEDTLTVSGIESEKSVSLASPRPAERKLVILRSVPANELKARSSEIVKSSEDKLASTDKSEDPGLALCGKQSKNELMRSSEARSSPTTKQHEDTHSSSEGKSKTVEKKGRSGVRRSRFGSIPQISQGKAPGLSASNLDSTRGRPLSTRCTVDTSKSEQDENASKKRKAENANVKESPASGFDSETHPALFDAPLPEGRVPRKKARI